MLTFTRSRDLFSDNSVILVDLAGHTPGSVGVLAHTRRGWTLIQTQGVGDLCRIFAGRVSPRPRCDCLKAEVGGEVLCRVF